MNGFPEHDLDWQAFAYWADELSAAERSRFEALLEDDQLAREALARVVELSHAVIAAESLAVSPVCRQPVRSSRRRIAAWTAGIAASALALLLGVAIGQWPGWSATSGAGAMDPDLASAWSDIRSNWNELTAWQQVASVDAATDTAGSDAADSDVDDTIEQQTGSDWESTAWNSSDLETPSWMTAAVVGQAAETEDGVQELPDTDSLPVDSSKES